MTAADRHAQAWLDVEAPLDRQLSPLGMLAIDALAPKAGDRVLDIGCGTGQTVLQLAQRVEPHGQVVGVDIAPRLLERARRRAAGLKQAQFIDGDAAALELADASVDGIFSRFGVMRFADPVAAFANFHRMLKPSGRLAFVCWRALEENEIDILPLRASGLEGQADRAPFSLESADFTRGVLGSAGFKDAAIAPLTRAVTCGGLEETLAVLTKVGVLGKILRDNPEHLGSVAPRLRTALERRSAGGHIYLDAAIWLVTATA